MFLHNYLTKILLRLKCISLFYKSHHPLLLVFVTIVCWLWVCICKQHNYVLLSFESISSIILLDNPIIWYNIFYWQSFSGMWKKPRKQSPLEPKTFYIITSSHQYSFSLVASNFYYGIFYMNEHLAWIHALFYLMDIWLCKLISENC